jgi:AraC-like DNA-binding protein
MVMTVSVGTPTTTWVNGLGDQNHCNEWAPVMKTSSTTQYSCFPVSRRDRQWGLYVTTVGHSRIPRGSEYPPKDHPGACQLDRQRGRSLEEYQLVYISHGSGTLEMPHGKQWSVEAGDLFLLVPGAWHRYWPHSDTGWNEHWVGFDGRIVRSAIMKQFLSDKAPVLRVRNEDEMSLKFAELWNIVTDRRPALQQIMAGIVFEMLGTVYSDQQGGISSMQRGSEAVRKAIQWMIENRNGHLEMRDLARRLRLSYSYFRRTFKQQTGMSPHQYWMDLKLSRARTLLNDPSLSIKEVAFRAGFDSQQYFSRLLKEKLGCTPGEFRARRKVPKL